MLLAMMLSDINGDDKQEVIMIKLDSHGDVRMDISALYV